MKQMRTKHSAAFKASLLRCLNLPEFLQERSS